MTLLKNPFNSVRMRQRLQLIS